MRIFFIFLFIAGTSSAQNFRFNEYTIEDGISQNFIYAIEQDTKGYLWVSTGDGLCKFDGKKFHNYTTKNGLSENIITTSFINKNGALWLGHNNGSISIVKNDKIVKLSSNPNCASTIMQICGNSDLVYFISQNEGLFQVLKGKIVPIGNFGFSGFYALEILDKENLIIGTDEGIVHLVLKNNKWVKHSRIFQDNWVTAISPGKINGVYLVALQDQGIVEVKLVGKNLKYKKWLNSKTQNVTINCIFEDDLYNVWLGTNGAGVIKVKSVDKFVKNGRITAYNSKTGLSSDFVKSIFSDREGNLWIGTFGAGLSSLQNEFFIFHTLPIELTDPSIYSLVIEKNKQYLGLESGLFVISNDSINTYKYYTDSSGFIKDRVTTIFKLNNSLWIGTLKNGVFEFDLTKKKFKAQNIGSGTLSKHVNQISGNNNKIWVATQGGLYSYDLASKKVELFDMSTGLGHNAIQSVQLSKSRGLLIGTYSRYLYQLKNGNLSKFQIKNSGELEIVSITESFDKNVWIATSEDGIYRFDGKNFKHYTVKEGLMSNYTYSIHNDKLGNIWIGHQGGLSKFNAKDGQFTIYNYLKGIKGQMLSRSMVFDDLFSLWIGGEHSLINYKADNDKKNSIAPTINLTKLIVDEKVYSTSQLIELPHGNYRIQFEFIGISFKSPENITYKYVLEGHDKAMSEITSENFAIYGNLSDGEYTFKVYAYNEEGVRTELPAQIKLIIEKPFWKKAWFIFLSLLLFSVIMYLLFELKTRAYKRNEQILQSKLEEKTKEVVEKADKIEEINKDLTDSINYAKRIQSSLLPEVNVLTSLLPNSFVFFKPRNIVSGDFYFIEKYDNKLIVACVDCTGHGVPGAFMSMIGSVTLRNIYNSSLTNWKTPNEVMEVLDSEIKILLQERSEHSTIAVISRDGMDMTLCEINLDTKEVLFASARNSVFIMKNEEIITIKGDRRSIGDTDSDSTPFTLHKETLSSNDSLYLTTDGYTDQFGGLNDKKLSVKGTREVITSLQSQDKSQFESAIASNFELWRSGQNQTDDVLFIGILF